MTTIKFTGKKSDIAFRATYDDEKKLASVDFNEIGNWNDLQREFFAIQIIEKLMRKFGDVFADEYLKNIFEILIEPTDLSFEFFWNEYANKIGKKERATQLYKLLSEQDKAAAILGIKKYKKWLFNNPSVQMLYPETYLAQRRWENEF